MNGRAQTYIRTPDPISTAGITAALRGRAEIEVVPAQMITAETVGVVAADTLDHDTLDVLRAVRRLGCRRFVLVATVESDSALIPAVELGVRALASRAEATGHRLAQLVVSTASGGAAMPPEVLGLLVKQVTRLQQTVLAPRGIDVNGLSVRESEILRLVADGMDTREVATRLSYSERTVKNVLHDITSRFQLRNRTHAVAYAVREGLI
ncbi:MULTISPECIES: helix-turn-helix transcriptional regulator [Micromonospora]|uniref:DNA-binding response regulator, NarL/FixJ family, contains REC and HTH domains n=1 Tax=Micromonospora rifamycinica TaxID=291594 RepID=A0A109IG66_9ACTN|nr:MULTISPECIES: response regulator transcription factor [Micromonospora]KWV29967.1 helix-turn-helix transcriptional regulator [Micromonospora rifamycinica]WFE63795.1 response regulator transcription factor [Micromonospora sp. WMMD714]SCG64161.1 DNA-binding response regulator, NarL/FixJ family, contains REC and HTH domains [Micromonospora rifamycinica]